MEVWFEDYAKIKVRPSSHQTYRGYIDNHINPNIGDIPIHLPFHNLTGSLLFLFLEGIQTIRFQFPGNPPGQLEPGCKAGQRGFLPQQVLGIHQVHQSAPQNKRKGP